MLITNTTVIIHKDIIIHCIFSERQIQLLHISMKFAFTESLIFIITLQQSNFQLSLQQVRTQTRFLNHLCKTMKYKKVN